MEKVINSTQSDANDDRVLATYQVIAERRLGYDQMAWQTPALSFTAQAFLFSIALAPGASQAARLVSSSLALLVSLISIQLLRKHHHMELIDSLILERLEERIGVHRDVGLDNPPHTPAPERRSGLILASDEQMRGGPLVDRHSPLLWTIALGLFAVAAITVPILSFAGLLP